MNFRPTGIDITALEASVRESVQRALAEDVGTGDVSAALIDSANRARATVITRDAGVFCGQAWVSETCRQHDATIEVDFLVDDGDAIEPDQQLFTLLGPAATLLTVERTLLNFVQLLSGTATTTRHYLALISGTSTQLLDTRKTVPGLRLAQKYAVNCGGGRNHRLGLYDQFLIKENHITAAGGITPAVQRARVLAADLKVVVEVETFDELQEAISAGADVAMIDNFSLIDTHKAVQIGRGRIALESSGGITEKSITDIAEAGVDYISVGSLTKAVAPIDLSMRMEPA